MRNSITVSVVAGTCVSNARVEAVSGHSGAVFELAAVGFDGVGADADVCEGGSEFAGEGFGAGDSSECDCERWVEGSEG